MKQPTLSFEKFLKTFCPMVENKIVLFDERADAYI
jgi:hypothetical protein